MTRPSSNGVHDALSGQLLHVAQRARYTPADCHGRRSEGPGARPADSEGGCDISAAHDHSESKGHEAVRVRPPEGDLRTSDSGSIVVYALHRIFRGSCPNTHRRRPSRIMDMRATPEDENTVDRLWAAAADWIHSARGWALRPLGQMGRLRQDRYTWLADGPTGTVVVKVSANEFAYDRAAWAAEALSLLRARGMPVPVPLWWGQLDRPWWALLQPRLPGDRVDALQAPLLDELVALIELQAGLGLVLGKAGWDVSWWID